MISSTKDSNTDNPVLISIDTEGPTGKDPVAHMIYGQTAEDGQCGIGRLMDCFDSFSVKGLFFVDVAEAWEYGDAAIHKVIDDIKKRGHDVGMHVHPDHMADKSRRYLWEYSYDEQKAILSKCTEWYIEHFGEHPQYFRAGRYGADDNTLMIISQLGYKYDFSDFYGRKGCKINPSVTCNKVVNYKGIIEIPVSTYKSFKSPIYERFDKLDIALDEDEFISIVDKMRTDDSVDVISFFLHSFSLIEWRTHVDSPTLLKKEEEKLYNIMKYMNDHKYHFIKAADIESIDVYEGPLIITDYSRMKKAFSYFARRAYRTVKMRIENNI